LERVIIHPAPLSGCITPPPSKSVAHRTIICAALAHGKSVVYPFEPSEDISATIAGMRTFGASIIIDENKLYIDGTNTFSVKSGEIDCGESGSTLRFLIPLAAVVAGDFTFTGHGRLPKRPIGPYLECLPKAGVICKNDGGLPLKMTGELKAGVFALPGNISSQFITGLLLALPLLYDDSHILLTTPLESKGYIALTLETMNEFGVDITETSDGYLIRGGQQYLPCDVNVESDWSQAAFWLAAGCLGGPVACRGLRLSSLQGDMAISTLLEAFGGDIDLTGTFVTARTSELFGNEIDASQIPDLVPILAATACFASGRTIIKNAARLRIKESDRLHAITIGLRSLGAHITELDDGIVIDGAVLQGGEAEGFNDHRIVMALSIAAAFCKRDVSINGCDCINKSYPEFFNDFRKLGGKADVINMG